MANFIMAGRWQALVFVLVTGILALWLPPLMLFSAAAIALVSLRKGWSQGLFIAVLGTVGLAAATQLASGSFQDGLLGAVVQWLPLVLIASVLTHTVSWERVFQIILILVVSGLLFFYAITPDVQAFWQDLLKQAMQPMVDTKQVSSAEAEENAALMARWATGAFGAGVAIFWVLAMFIARYWQALLYNPGGFGEEFRALRAGQSLALVVLLMVVMLAVTQNEMAGNLVIAGMVLFLFHGLGLVHGLVHNLNMHKGWLFGIYAFLILAFQIAAILLISFALIDTFADFRNKLTAKR